MSASVISEGTITAEQIDKDTLIDTHYGAIAANAMLQKLGDLIVQQKGTGQISEGLRSLVKGRAGAGVGLQPRRRRGQAGSLHELGAEYDKLKKLRGHAQVWRRFLLQKSRGRFPSSKASTRACACSSPSLGTAIYHHQVDWNADQLKWDDFRGKV